MAQSMVVDASALGALIFGEPQRYEVAARVAGFSLSAPDILPFELANLCLSKCRRQPASRDDLFAKYEMFREFNIDLLDVNHSDVLLLAEETGLTAYDASYLWLAHHLDAELVTLDGELASAHALLQRS